MINVHLPYSDALIVTLAIAHYGVRKVLIDNGSNTNFIFAHTVEKISLDLSRMRAIRGKIIGFSIDVVDPIREIQLSITMGKTTNYVTIIDVFVILNAPLIMSLWGSNGCITWELSHPHIINV